MRKWWPFFLTLLVLLLIVHWPVHASTTTLTGTLKDSFGNPINGTLILQLPVPAQDTTTNVAVSNAPVSCRIVNGVITGCPPLFDVANLQPQNLYYITRAYDTSGTLIFNGNYPVTGGSFNLGAAAPTSVTTSNISYINPASLSGNNTWTGLNTWTQQMTSTVSTGTAPLVIASTTVVPNLNISNLNGVVVSGTPSSGQSLTATAANAATWQSPANVTSSYVNQTPTGTIVNQLAKLTGAPSTAVQTAITDTGGAIGICISNCTTSGSSAITTVGQASCAFDAGTTAGDYVIISPNIAGNCKDSGATYPASGQVLGRVLSTNGGAGTYNMTLFGAEPRGSTPNVTIPVTSNKNLGGSVALTANTLTVLDSLSVTMPSTGGPWRVLVCYAYFHNASSGLNVGESFVTDSVNNFAFGIDPVGGSSGGGYLACGTSPVTYANGANPTFTVKAENAGGQTVQTTSQLLGLASHVTINVMSGT